MKKIILLLLLVILVSGCFDSAFYTVTKIGERECITKDNVTMECTYNCKENIWQICKYTTAIPSGDFLCFC